MYEKILLAVDGSDNSIRAAEEAIKIARLVEESRITAVFVAEFSKAKNEVIHARGKEELELKRRKKIQPVIDRIESESLQYQVEILRGEPGPEIVKFVNEGEFDLLVIGSRGLNVFQEMVLGSVSHKVVKRADCPVMVVK